MTNAYALPIRSVAILFFIIMMTTISSLSLTASVASSKKKLVLKLMHRDSKLSPFYDSDATIWELRKRAIARSFKRAAYLSKSRLSTTFPHRVTRTDNNTEDVIGIGLHPTTSTYGGTNLFLANISVGQPPVLQTLAVDTGSDVTWISCAPCPDCGRRTVQLFNSNRSSTYTRLPCWRDCRHYGGDWCNWQLEDNCTFTTRYNDGSNVAGDLVTEQVVFTTVGGGTYPPVVIDGIGCAHSMTYTGPDGGNGILGLGPRSFVNQIGGKFSYCLGDASDPNYAFSRLIIGDGANLFGDKLNGSVKAGQFLVGMTGISVDEEILDIDPFVFVPDHGDRDGGGVILDTGSALTYLIKDAYNELYDKVESVTSNILTPVLDYDSELLCYAGRVDREVSDFPYVTFHFEGGVDLVLGPRSFFLQVEPNVVCMAVAAASGNLSVIGVMAQQDYSIGFDNYNASVYIQSIDCSIYFDNKS